MNLKKTIVLAAAVLVVGAIAWAQSNPDPVRDHVEQFRWRYPQFFNQALNANFVDAGALMVNSKGFTPVGRGTLVYDFPALTGTVTGLDTLCAESSVGTATGCAFGDGVMLGIDQVLVNSFGNVNAYVSAANAFKVRACVNGITDGGSFNMPDASYTVTCVR